MRPAPISGTHFLLFSLALPLCLTAPDRAEAAPKPRLAQHSASTPGGVSSSSVSSGSASSGSASSSSSASGDAPAADAADPWEGRGAPADDSSPGAAEPPLLPPEPPPDEPPMDPRTAYHKGNAAFRDGRFTAARHYYRRALEADTSFDVLCNLGRAEAELKDNVPAYVHLTHCLDAYPRDPELSATRASFASLREDVQSRLTPEQNERAEAMLAEGPPKPLIKEELALVVAPAPAPAPDVDLGPRSPGPRTAMTLTLGGLALVGVGGGVGFYLYSTDLGAQADALREGIIDDESACPSHQDCEDLRQTLVRSDEAQHIALGSFIAAGGLATAAILTYVLWPHEYGPARSATGPRTTASHPLGHLRPSAAFDPARGSMWVGLGGRF